MINMTCHSEGKLNPSPSRLTFEASPKVQGSQVCCFSYLRLYGGHSRPFLICDQEFAPLYNDVLLHTRHLPLLLHSPLIYIYPQYDNVGCFYASYFYTQGNNEVGLHLLIDTSYACVGRRTLDCIVHICSYIHAFPASPLIVTQRKTVSNAHKWRVNGRTSAGAYAKAFVLLFGEVLKGL